MLNSGATGPDKRFQVVLSNPALNGVGTPSLFAATSVSNAMVSIHNDNSYGTFQFSTPGYVVNEDGGYATLTVIRTGGTNGAASVHFATADATAFAGTNYLGTNGTLNFAAGQLAAGFTVSILDDGRTNPPPGAFYFTVALSSPSAGASLGSPSAANVSIVDAKSYNRPPGFPDTTFNLGGRL